MSQRQEDEAKEINEQIKEAKKARARCPTKRIDWISPFGFSHGPLSVTPKGEPFICGSLRTKLSQASKAYMIPHLDRAWLVVGVILAPYINPWTFWKQVASP